MVLFALLLAVSTVSTVSTAANSNDNVFRLVTLGDSITKGFRKGVEPEETFSALLERDLSEGGITVEVINVGIGGERTDQALQRLEKDVIALAPDCVTIMYGTNDAYCDSEEPSPRLSLEEYEANLRAIVVTLSRAKIKPVLMTEPPLCTFAASGREPFKSNGKNFMMIPFMEAVRRVADSMDVPLVDNFTHWNEAAMLGQDLDLWMTDGMHPNPEGHKVIAETILRTFTRNISMRPPGYSIPIIDLVNETDRQVVVDREKGQYLGHPTTVLLDDKKTMICVYPKGHGRGPIVMKKSYDGGLTWTDRLPVPENWATSMEVPTIYPVVDRGGKKRLIMFSGLYPIRMAVSEDNGENWGPLEKIGDYGGIVAMGDLMRLKDGSYMTFFHDDGRFLRNSGRRTNVFEVYKVTSEDGGLTWSEPVVTAKHEAAHLCEPGLIRSPDGGTIAMLLRENSRRFNAFVTFSKDEGETWSKPVELPAALTGDRHKGIYTPDGRIVFVFRDKAHKSPTYGDFVAWVGSWEDIINGREGQYRVRLGDNTRGTDCGYPGLELLPDGTIVATTYGHWTLGEEPYVMSFRFTTEELDKKAESLEK